MSHRVGASDHRLTAVRTPLVWQAWKQALVRHPDQEFAEFLLRGIQSGFRTGVDVTRTFTSARNNMQSASQHAGVIDDFIAKEVEKGNILGPFPPAIAPKVHINRIGAIPKKHQPGKWRVITDLSFPDGQCVNESITSECCSMQYITVEQVAKRAMQLGKGSLIAKIDIKAAYRLVPVHPEDRIWQGLTWNNQVYVDAMLPFGLCSAPKIFNAIADCLEWYVADKGVDDIFHYLDDFATLGRAGTHECHESLRILKLACEFLGIPLGADKEDGPSPVIVLLGIVIDTIKGELRLPEDKLARLLQVTAEWARRAAHPRANSTRAELESLVGTLCYAAKVIPPGRSFLRRAISLMKKPKKRHHHVRLTKEFKADMLWWKHFASGWNGASVLVTDEAPEVLLTSDASGSWGCGAWQGSQWFQLPWEAHSQALHIAAKELIPILVAAVVWGTNWGGCKVVARCDNMAVVEAINRRYCKDANLMQLLRGLYFIEARRHFHLSASHIPGVHNSLADDLSRDRLPSFLRAKPDATHNPTYIPPPLLQWLLDPKLQWTSPIWMQLFSTFVPME